MSGMNYSRVLIGGLAAGAVLVVGELILSWVLLADDWQATAVDSEALAYGTWASIALVGVVWLNGLVLIWLYAAIRPRFGPGSRTAILAGLTLWLIAWALMGLSLMLTGVVTPRVSAISAFWGFFEVPLAALVGAWLYREGGDERALA